ncbi:sugar ABC transporter substrate-binding protein [Pelagicoccus mobilis]|uniref:Sugar ABC transporter substrate-binding protein n=1 Tax=Pelagicoccus mobilis TaxID=415221 RepID=A0A934RXW9_9BACT|nr:sugar ABC transporter substrate-binding protein [Pelagicoccus mobilis]MBK1875568.1 sugar ABC transporter substrate-binding protein [Pelagicoccus mobilis]
MKITPFSSAFAALVLSLSFLGCSPKSDEADSKPEVALVMKSLANEFFQTMSKGAEDHAANNTESYSLIVNGIKNETDLGQQLNLVEQMVARGVDAIVIAPADSKALIPALKRATDAGVLVINIDNRLDKTAATQAGLNAPFVGPDNRAGAKAAASVLTEQLQSGDQVAIIEGVPTAFNGQQRRLGFEDALKESGAKIVSVQAGNWEMAKANTIAASLLTAHPNLKAILCANDSMALGAVAAIQAAGRTEVKVVGFDNISAIQPMIADGRVLATADQHGDQLAVYGIEAALAILAGEQAPADRTTAVDVISK